MNHYANLNDNHVLLLKFKVILCDLNSIYNYVVYDLYNILHSFNVIVFNYFSCCLLFFRKVKKFLKEMPCKCFIHSLQKTDFFVDTKAFLKKKTFKISSIAMDESEK